MRAVIYARISRDEGGAGLGVQRQIEDCTDLLALSGVKAAETYVDNDISAYSGRVRPEYQRLVADLERGRISKVVAWAPERLHRSPRELEDFIDLLEKTGATVETVKSGNWDVSTSNGRMLARMLGAVSRAESERTGERVSRAHQQAKENGFWRGPIPYGLGPSDVPGKPRVIEAEAQVVRQIVERINRGDALTRIAAELNEEGIKPRRGQAWTHTGVSRLLASPALGGMVQIGGELRPAAFDGILSEGEWRTALASLRRRPRGESRRPREKLTLLGGILRCAEHGHICVGSSASHGATYTAGMPGQCYVSITRRAADLAVSGAILARLGQADAEDLLAPVVDTDGLTVEAITLRLRRQDLAGLIGEGLMTADAAREQLERIANRLAEIDSAQAPNHLTIDQGADPLEAWNEWTITQRRELVRVLFETVEVRHVGQRHGPRADPSRISLGWAN